jgi:hypothetical protein
MYKFDMSPSAPELLSTEVQAHALYALKAFA